jgi:hypothetical protein
VNLNWPLILFIYFVHVERRGGTRGQQSTHVDWRTKEKCTKSCEWGAAQWYQAFSLQKHWGRIISSSTVWLNSCQFGMCSLSLLPYICSRFFYLQQNYSRFMFSSCKDKIYYLIESCHMFIIYNIWNESLYICDCKNLKAVLIAEDTSQHNLLSLRIIEVEDCRELESICTIAPRTITWVPHPSKSVKYVFHVCWYHVKIDLKYV